MMSAKPSSPDANPSITIRLMREGEKREASRVMRRSFSPMIWPFFSWGKHNLVALHQGQIVGAVALNIFNAAKRKVGFIAWVFTDPSARGLGAGQKLIDEAIAFLEAQECTELSCCVEGYNTSSSNLFSTRGFTILSPGEQLHRYGLGIIPYWWHAFHFMDLGHFMWARPGQTRPDSALTQWWGTWLLNALLLILAIYRGNSLLTADVWGVPFAVLLVLGLRALAMRQVAAMQGLAVRFRAWETGAVLVGFIAALLSGYFPFPGSYYPDQTRWRYKDLLSKLGPMALAGSMAVLGLAWASWAMLRWDLLPVLKPAFVPLYQISVTLAILDSVTAFFPMISYNGRRLWDWNRGIWVAVSLAALGLIFFAI